MTTSAKIRIAPDDALVINPREFRQFRIRE